MKIMFSKCFISFQVKWARENYHHDLMSPYTLRLASADAGGKIVVWDVAQAAVKSEFSEGQKPVLGSIVHLFFIQKKNCAYFLLFDWKGL
jgi:hypothetical protein